MNSTNISLKQRRKDSQASLIIKERFLKDLKKRKSLLNLPVNQGFTKTLNTNIFKTNGFKLCERYPKLLGSSIGLGIFKNYHKDIKAVSKENEEDFP